MTARGADEGAAGRAAPGPAEPEGRRGGSPGRAGGAGDPEAAEDGRPPNLLVRAALVFVAPGALVDELRRKPVWIGMLAVVVGLSLAGAILLPEELMEQLLRSRMGDEATEADVQRALGLSQPLGYVLAVVGPPAAAVALAGLLSFVYTLVLGGRGSFRTLFSASVHAMLIPTVGGLLVLPVMISAGDPELGLALHLLVPGLDAESYLYAFLRGLDVFSLWTAAVLGVAVGRIYERRSAGASAALLIGLYAAVKAVVPLVGP